jgi:hypothetical protein
VEFAAQIAATHSKAKQDTKVDVSYTQRKHLRSPPQRVKKPGMVRITREREHTCKLVVLKHCKSQIRGAEVLHPSGYDNARANDNGQTAEA